MLRAAYGSHGVELTPGLELLMQVRDPRGSSSKTSLWAPDGGRPELEVPAPLPDYLLLAAALARQRPPTGLPSTPPV